MIEYKGKQVTIMACSDCNARCKHCYISYSGNLTGKQLVEICNNLKNKYKIILNGTELLIHNDYIEALKLSDQKRILTNGIIIYQDSSILDMIKTTGIQNIAMSYHFGSSVSDVPHHIVEKAIKKILNSGLNPELMCTITTENYNRLDYICKKVKELDVGTIRLFNCLNAGRCKCSDDMSLDDSQLREFFNELERVRSNYDINELSIKRNGTFGSSQNCKSFNCIAGIDEVIITPDSNVYPCIYLARKGFEIGKYIDGKIYLDKLIENDGTKCLAREYYNCGKPINFTRTRNDK